MEKIYLPIGANYVAHWGLWEAVREILQNAIDTNDYDILKFEDQGIMNITSNGGALEVSTLMLGESTKRDDENLIGKYGEGYKLAMLVLCRAGYEVKIINGADLWLVSIEEHPQLKTNCLCVSIQEGEFHDNDKVSFVIKGMTADDFTEVKEKFIAVDGIDIEAESDGSQCFNYEYSDTKKLFVGGLFVCDLPDEKEYWFSYNLKPNVINLDRDRNAVDEFYLQLAASRLIENSGNIELLLDMANANAEDISGYHEPVTYYHRGDEGTGREGGYDKNKIESLALAGFIKNNGDNAYPIRHDLYGDEKKAVIAAAVSLGMNPVETKQVIYKNLPKELINKINVKKLDGKISAVIFKFLEENKKHMRSKSFKALTEINQSIAISGK